MASGVLRPSSIETVRQEEDHAALSQPLGLRAHEVLVDHKLSWVVEIAELGLSQAEILRAL